MEMETLFSGLDFLLEFKDTRFKFAPKNAENQ